MPVSTFTDPDVRAIKSRLWLGETCEAISRDLDVSSNAIRAICCGARWANVPWPEPDDKGNAIVGGMPERRRKEINAARKEAQAELHKSVKRKLKSS